MYMLPTYILVGKNTFRERDFLTDLFEKTTNKILKILFYLTKGLLSRDRFHCLKYDYNLFEQKKEKLFCMYVCQQSVGAQMVMM